MRTPAAAGGDEDALVCKILQIPRGGGLRCSGDDHVLLGAHVIHLRQDYRYPARMRWKT